MELSAIFTYLQQTVTKLQTILPDLTTLTQQLQHKATEHNPPIGDLL